MSRIENWGKRGRVVVTRDAHGRFKSWKPVATQPAFSIGFEAKSVAIYGYASIDGGRRSRRFEFTGNGKDLFRAIRMAHNVVPSNKNRFVKVYAREFLSRPFHYGVRGFWVDKEIES